MPCSCIFQLCCDSVHLRIIQSFSVFNNNQVPWVTAMNQCLRSFIFFWNAGWCGEWPYTSWIKIIWQLILQSKVRFLLCLIITMILMDWGISWYQEPCWAYHCVISFNPHGFPMMYALFPFCGWGSWGLKFGTVYKMIASLLLWCDECLCHEYTRESQCVCVISP